MELDQLTHPYQHLFRLIHELDTDRQQNTFFSFRSFSFDPGRYSEDVSNSYRDRSSLRLSAKDVLRRERLDAFLKDATEKREDVTLQSTVICNERLVHLPMIDFAHMAPGPNQVIALSDRSSLKEFTFYASGRSFHGYGRRLVTEKEFLAHLGSMLLLNDPENEIVDQRWVGHSLVRGEGSLRWTRNNPRYKKLPTLIPNPFEP